MNGDVSILRNIGISAHIDSGKTTLSERILFYTQRIRAMHEVKGKDGAGATMDYMDLERERGITITSAATHIEWNRHFLNLIDTPGHVDFTIEVERALRVLDGGILVLCAVGGVQSQSITVDRQMNRYRVPRIAFVNKCDRRGAGPARVVRQIREMLGLNAVLLQIPIGLEADFAGVVDLVRQEAVYFDGPEGREVRREEIPAALREEALARRQELLDAATLCSDELTEAVLEERATEAQIHAALRRGVLQRRLVPVLLGSAYRNKGIQPLLDAVVHYLPCPADVENTAVDLERDDASVPLTAGEGPLVALAFKLEEGRYGQLTYVRVYQGRLARGTTILNARTGKKVRVGRLVRVHADQLEEIDSSAPGDIVALFGIECASGDTFCDPDRRWAMTSMHVPEPVIGLAVEAADEASKVGMSKALGRFTREDPTFRAHVDPESGETILRGMGELHLEVYLERMRREYKVRLTAGPPQVAYRETIGAAAEFDHTHRKQTGGAGQYGRVIGTLEPFPEGEYELADELVGNAIPREFVTSLDKGFRACLRQGSWIGAPVTGVRLRITDGASHAVDSSDLAFQHTAIGAFRDAYARARPAALEPVMKVAVETPAEFQGAVLGSLIQRRGTILGTQDDGALSVVEAEVPLAEMFGYSTTLRSRTQGKAEFTMEFARYRPVPVAVAEELRRRYLEKLRRGGTRD